ncbi:hypothetical protein BC936DRAFT_140172 [Jimgerdemannia flammicorona]|uniref:EamA domain-containing protein n=1 Tax=Jimgerdemannia flammicorona TaxID=994334 RepID=A0A433DH33_9FUNG|nr:hypothetical protein BC936DRAFT_140172 [Jimgerdemannia flammicorona]
MIPLQFFYEWLLNSPSDRLIAGTPRSTTTERYLTCFAASLIDLVSTIQPSSTHYGHTLLNGPEEDRPLSTTRLLRPHLRYLLRLATSLAILICIPSYLWYVSINLTTMANLTAIYNTACFFVYAFSVALLGERVLAPKVAAVLLCIAGVSIISFWHPENGDVIGTLSTLSSPTASFLGSAVATVGAAGYGFYEVFYKKYASPPTASVLFANTLTGLIGLSTLLLLWLPLPLFHLTGIEPFSLPNVRTLAYILLISIIGVFFNASIMCVIAMTSPVFAAVAIMLTIPAVAVADVIVTGKDVPASTALGSALILVGFVLLCVELRNEGEAAEKVGGNQAESEIEP